MSRKSSDVIKEANKMFKEGYVYVYGYKGTKVTEKGVRSLASAYPNVFTSSILKKALTKVGKIGIDCSGFVNKAAGTNLGGSTSIKDSFPTKYKISKTSHIVDKSYGFVMPRVRSVDIDYKEDFDYVEFLMSRR